jgi:hypothetical protein
MRTEPVAEADIMEEAEVTRVVPEEAHLTQEELQAEHLFPIRKLVMDL